MVYVWVQDSPRSSTWTKVALNPQGSPSGASKFGDAVWRVSWSVSGQVLAVASGDGKVTLWKENLKCVALRRRAPRSPDVSRRGIWELVTEME